MQAVQEKGKSLGGAAASLLYDRQHRDLLFYLSVAIFLLELVVGVVALLYNGVARVIFEVAGSWLNPIPFSQIVLPLALIFVLVGVLVGFFGGFISIRKYLKKEGNEILGW